MTPPTGHPAATQAAAALARLDEALELVRGARAVPVSTSCVVSRPELLALLEEARSLVPQAVADAAAVVREADDVVEAGRREAARIVAAAQAERLRLLDETEVVAAAHTRAEEQVADAEAHAARLRSDVDAYVDSRLANFEVVLARTTAAVQRGREKLQGRLETDGLGG